MATPEDDKRINTRHTEEDNFGAFAQPEVYIGLEKPPQLYGEKATFSVGTEDRQDGLLIDTTTTKPPPSPSFQELNGPLELSIPPEAGHATPVDQKPEESTPITAWPSYGRDRAKSFGKPLPLSPYTDDDEWGDFEGDAEPQHVVSERAKNQPSEVHSSRKGQVKQNDTLLDLLDSPKTTTLPAGELPKLMAISTIEPPPSNIPPPSILLSVVAKICNSLSTEIRDIVSSSSTALMQDGLVAGSPHLEKLFGAQAVINASARILAGRKLRWKRDTHLAQSMRIGTANTGKANGMKLPESTERRIAEKTKKQLKW